MIHGNTFYHCRKENNITVELQVIGILDREGGQVVCASTKVKVLDKIFAGAQRDQVGELLPAPGHLDPAALDGHPHPPHRGHRARVPGRHKEGPQEPDWETSFDLDYKKTHS